MTADAAQCAEMIEVQVGMYNLRRVIAKYDWRRCKRKAVQGQQLCAQHAAMKKPR